MHIYNILLCNTDKHMHNMFIYISNKRGGEKFSLLFFFLDKPLLSIFKLVDMLLDAKILRCLKNIFCLKGSHSFQITNFCYKYNIE